MRADAQFFVAGGTLRSDAPSYVQRPADDELFNQALAGEFCYVLTPRQMGKSSLMIRTARRLGGDVTIVYRRTQEEMPARVEEGPNARGGDKPLPCGVFPTAIVGAGFIPPHGYARNPSSSPLPLP